LAQWRVIPLWRDRLWLIEHSTSHQTRRLSGWCIDSFGLRNPPLRQQSDRKMNDNDTKRLSRLTAILTQLQTKRLLTATKLAEKFNVSIRTIYRDIRTLEQAGVPILTEDGKGYMVNRIRFQSLKT
jgi:biotin operon repressor